MCGNFLFGLLNLVAAIYIYIYVCVCLFMNLGRVWKQLSSLMAISYAFA